MIVGRVMAVEGRVNKVGSCGDGGSDEGVTSYGDYE